MKLHNRYLCRRFFWHSFDIDCWEITHAKLQSVVAFGKLITVVEQEASAHHRHCSPYHEVSGGEPVLDFMIWQLQNTWWKWSCKIEQQFNVKLKISEQQLDWVFGLLESLNASLLLFSFTFKESIFTEMLNLGSQNPVTWNNKEMAWK